jgi:serine carboxypeptidase 1
VQTTPFYIFSESYGGKMTTDITLAILDAVDTGALNASLRGIEMGDSWISGQADVDGWGPYLYATSVIDEAGAASIKASGVCLLWRGRVVCVCVCVLG